MLKVLGLDRYTERLKKWVREHIPETPYQRYCKYVTLVGEPCLFTNEKAYDKYMAVRANMADFMGESPWCNGEEYGNGFVPWSRFNLTWAAFVAIKDCPPNFVNYREINDEGVLNVWIYDFESEDVEYDDEDNIIYAPSWGLRINPNDQTAELEGY